MYIFYSIKFKKINRFCGMNKAAYYKYSYWGVVQSTKYIIGRLEINFSNFIKFIMIFIKIIFVYEKIKIIRNKYIL